MNSIKRYLLAAVLVAMPVAAFAAEPVMATSPVAPEAVATSEAMDGGVAVQSEEGTKAAEPKAEKKHAKKHHKSHKSHKSHKKHKSDAAK